MKISFILLVLILINSYQLTAQKMTSKIVLAKNIELIAVIEKFDSTKHHYDTCTVSLGWEENGWQAICLIDGQIWFGSDLGLELPKNKLLKLILVINGTPIKLETTSMFNINVGTLTIRERQFKLEKNDIGYKLFGYFSDGAGTYTAHWSIIKNRAIRNVLSNDESYFLWQIEMPKQ